jgi:hypothetical protein
MIHNRLQNIKINDYVCLVAKPGLPELSIFVNDLHYVHQANGKLLSEKSD